MRLQDLATNPRELARLLENPHQYLEDHASLQALDRERQTIERASVRRRLALSGQAPDPEPGTLREHLARGLQEIARHLAPGGEVRTVDEGARMAGIATLVVHDQEGGILWDESSVNRNVVVQVGRRKMVDAVINGTVEKVTKTRFGEGTTTPVETNTNLTTPHATEVDLSGIYRDAQTLKTSVYVGSDTLNGKSLAEGGLLYSDGTLLNHYLISPAIAKDSSKTVAGSVDIQLNAA